MATISRLLKITGLFCRIPSLLYVSFAKETYDFKEPTNRSHPITRVAVDADACYFGVALVNRIDKMRGLFRTRALYKRRYSAKETCNFKEPTNRSHLILENIYTLLITRFANILYTTNNMVQIQITSQSLFGFVLRDTEECEFLDLEDFKGVVFSV